jgi:pyruvate dehydrogenase E1 component
MGSGAILREVVAAADLLREDFSIDSDIWSATSFNELKREGQDVERYNMLNPQKEPRISHVEKCLSNRKGPVIAASDYMKNYADQIRAYVPRRYVVLGTDGFGRSDTRVSLRRHFEVDRHFIVLAALKALADEGSIALSEVARAIENYAIDVDKLNPRTA